MAAPAPDANTAVEAATGFACGVIGGFAWQNKREEASWRTSTS